MQKNKWMLPQRRHDLEIFIIFCLSATFSVTKHLLAYEESKFINQFWILSKKRQNTFLTHKCDFCQCDVLFVLRMTYCRSWLQSLRSSMAPRSVRVIAEVKQCWSVIGCVNKNLLSPAPPCFGRHVKPLVPAEFAVVSTHQPALGLRGGLWPVLLMCNPKGRPVPQQ
jgi:hypothetical protein